MEIRTIYTLFSYILSFVLANSGVISFKTNPEFWPIGLSLIVSGFLVLYFLSNISKIKENEEEINNLKKEVKLITQNIQADEKLLNTLKDIILLKKMNKKGISNTDVLEWLKIIITIIIGVIMIKALLSAV